jgi:hypothetical protein
MGTLNLTAKNIPITLNQGDTLSLALRHTDPETSDPIDMTGVVPLWIFESDEIEDLTIGDGLEWAESETDSGVFDLLLVEKDILWADTVAYQLKYTYPSGQKKTKMKGKVKSKVSLDPDE